MAKDYGTLEITKGQLKFISQNLGRPLPAQLARVRNRLFHIITPEIEKLNSEIMPILAKYMKKGEDGKAIHDEMGNPVYENEAELQKEWDKCLDGNVSFPIHASQLVEFQALKKIFLESFDEKLNVQETRIYEELCTVLENQKSL